MRQRTPRTVRGKPRHKLRLLERDLWILEGLAKMRFLTTGQITRLYFNGSPWYPNKRLRNLLDEGLVKTWVRNLAEENIYSITRSGVAALRSRNDVHPQFKIPYRLDENLTHLLVINEVRTAFAVTLPDANAEIAWWRSDWELRAKGKEKIIPDSLFVINWHGLKEQAYALEVDNNTRSLNNFLKKILAYSARQKRESALYGVINPILLVAGSDPKWLERYRLSVSELRLNSQVWFATVEDIKREGAKEAIWANGGKKKYSLRELSFSPYREDKSANKSTRF